MHKVKAIFLAAWMFLAVSSSLAMKTGESRWQMLADGSIEWMPGKQIPHDDHIEMSGKQVSVVLRYGVNAEGEFVINKSMVWPLLRTIPNNTHASLMRRFDWNPLDLVTVNGRTINGEKVEKIRLKGMLAVESSYNGGWYGQCKVIREYLPSVDQPALVENYFLINTDKKPMSVEIPVTNDRLFTDPQKGVDGSYLIEMKMDRNGYFSIQPGDTLAFSAYIIGYKKGQSALAINGQQEKMKRMEAVTSWMDNLVLETPDPVIDRMFAFSKIRACESIYETQGGPMHGPGGESYYAAIWANDQAEYINPYFPFTGYDYGNASALNSFKHFARFMNNEWKPIPSSIVAEGLDIWNGVGDRGDAAMIAYGASRYLLARASREEAEQLWPLVTWCLEYCNHKLNKEGVVASDTDELENRFPSGDANLCTSSLYYDALISAACLARELGKGNAGIYRKQAAVLRKNIEKYFGASVEGFDTYAYYKGNDILRSWICIPLTVGIDERAEATINALYALRGVYAVGETEKATEYLHRYSTTRLLGGHVPYAIEAWPEGGQRHLSAESGLYGRIITEGMFGIRPTGFKSFTLTPRLPEAWNHMALRRIGAFGAEFDIEIQRLSNNRIQVKIINGNKIQQHVMKVGNTLPFN